MSRERGFARTREGAVIKAQAKFSQLQAKLLSPVAAAIVISAEMPATIAALATISEIPD